MSFWQYWRQAGTFAWRDIYRSAWGKLRRGLTENIARYADRRKTTYAAAFSPKGLGSYLPPASPGLLAVLESRRESINGLASAYLAHRFDLLGSGWTQLRHGMECRGLHGYRYPCQAGPAAPAPLSVNASNRQEAQRIAGLLDTAYTPLDWHLDFKSGFRWPPAVWYRDVEYGTLPGVDVKVPWELARMQHLPILAWAFGLAAGGDRAAARVYSSEFRNQILDFIAANPPRYGVNWCSTMDVAIRLVNWLVAFDLFRSFGAEFDDSFRLTLERAIYEHARHCAENLEFSLTGRNNHYLAGLAGLFIAAAYLPATKESRRWLIYAGKELESELYYQFAGEGTSRESSTAYHCLAAEMLLWCALISLVLPEDKRVVFRRPFWERLERALEFIDDSLKPNREIPQFGDSDSGRFLKLWPCHDKRTAGEAVARYANLVGYPIADSRQVYWDENSLRQAHLPAIGARLFAGSRLAAEGATPETALVGSLLGDKRVSSYHARTAATAGGPPGPPNGNKMLAELYRRCCAEGGPSAVYRLKLPPATREGRLACLPYPAFGLYIYKGPAFYLAVRCGKLGRCGRGGHAHNDQLTVELAVDGLDIIRDPGTYLYTPLPAERNRFRSTRAHFTPQLDGREQNGWPEGAGGLFAVIDRCQARCLAFAADGFAGVHYGFGRPVYRIIRFCGEDLEIVDFGGGPPQTLPHGGCYSPGYGRLIQG